MDAHPAPRVQSGADRRLDIQGQVSVAGAEPVCEEQTRQAGAEFLLRRVAAAFHPGAAAGVQHDGPAHVPGLLLPQQRVKAGPQSAGQQRRPAALGQHGGRRGAGQPHAGACQENIAILPGQIEHPVHIPGLQGGRQFRRHRRQLPPQGIVPLPRAQIAHGLHDVQLHDFTSFAYSLIL